jgi:hypothetical protein
MRYSESNPPTARQIAEQFVAQLRADLTAEEFAEVQKRNRLEESRWVCHSHDFCDANMTMDAAFRHFGIDPLPDIENGMPGWINELWNAAWDIARTERMI